MPKLYIDIKEKLTDEEMLTIEPTRVFFEVDSKSEALSKVGSYLHLFTGKQYTKKIRTNNHDIKKDCTEEDI